MKKKITSIITSIFDFSKIKYTETKRKDNKNEKRNKRMVCKRPKR